MADFFDITWGRIRVWCSTVSTDNSRTQVVHELSSGDDHPIQDRGRVARKVTCALLFVEMPNEPLLPQDRLEDFIAQVDRGSVELFTHPLAGSYLVHVENFTYDLDEDGNVENATCTFIAAGELEESYLIQGRTSPITGVGDVSSRADALADALADFELESTIPTEAKKTSDGWLTTADVPIRDVLVGAATVSTALDALIVDEGLESNLDLWPVYQATVLLAASFRQAADAAVSETPSIFFMRIASPTSVLALVTRVYGGAESEARDRQVRALNDLRSPGGLIEAGVTVAMPAVPPSFRAAR